MKMTSMPYNGASIYDVRKFFGFRIDIIYKKPQISCYFANFLPSLSFQLALPQLIPGAAQFPYNLQQFAAAAAAAPNLTGFYYPHHHQGRIV